MQRRYVAALIVAASLAVVVAWQQGRSTGEAVARAQQQPAETDGPSTTSDAREPEQALPPPSWITVDLYDFTIELPGNPVTSDSVERVGQSGAKVRTYAVTRGSSFYVRARVLDFPEVSAWDSLAMVDLPASHGVEAVRRDEGPGATLVLNERRMLGALPGRAVEIHTAVSSRWPRPTTIRSVFYSRWARVYEVTIMTDDTADGDGLRVMRSLRATARAALPTPAAGWASAPVQMPSWQPGDVPPGYTAPPSGPSPTAGHDVHVRGYTNRNGVYVAPHTRSAPHR